jgi:hypothetical protein
MLSMSRGVRQGDPGPTFLRPQLTFSGTASSLSRPLKHLKAPIDTLTAMVCVSGSNRKAKISPKQGKSKNFHALMWLDVLFGKLETFPDIW